MIFSKNVEFLIKLFRLLRESVINLCVVTQITQHLLHIRNKKQKFG